MTANPAKPERRTDASPPPSPDRRDGRVYLMPDDLQLAVDVALATGRPLLIRGDPGTGKSSLAAYLALQRKCRYYEIVVSSHTQTQDLLWSFDVVRRLADAQGKAVQPDYAYVEPGILWWVLAPESARRRGLPMGPLPEDFVPPAEPFADLNTTREDQLSAVLLIDEIDKAEPDIPNGILVALGSNEFAVAETGTTVRPQSLDRCRHLIIITTNEERELPQAFLRRCVVTWLETPSKDPEAIRAIIREHTITYEEAWTEDDDQLAEALATELAAVAGEAEKNAIRQPSVAEALDAFRACRTLGIAVGSENWDQLTNLILLKRQQPGE
jgi:MoxR-like ATPase